MDAEVQPGTNIPLAIPIQFASFQVPRPLSFETILSPDPALELSRLAGFGTTEFLQVLGRFPYGVVLFRAVSIQVLPLEDHAR